MLTGRRGFLKKSFAGASLAFARTAQSAVAIKGANDRIRIGAIGTGGRCRYLLSLLGTIPGNQLVAVCDVYEPRRAEAKSRFATYAAEYVDYRKVLDDREVDAVVIGAPDHWHAPMTMDAVRAGKDVYVEKPVTHTIEEGSELVDVVARSGRVVQVGMQQRSWPHIAEAKAIVDSGVLGQVTLVESHWYQNYVQRRAIAPDVDPEKLDWQRFLGSAPAQPLDPYRFSNWRYYWDFGGGAMTDLFTHWVDVIHWYMGVNLPDSASATGSRFCLPRQECPDTITASFLYPAKFEVMFHTTLVSVLTGGGIMLRGTDAALKVEREGYALYPEPTTYTESLELPLPTRQVRVAKVDGTRDHLMNFLDCARSRKLPNANIWDGVDAVRPGQMANLAYRGGHTITAETLPIPEFKGRKFCF